MYLLSFLSLICILAHLGNAEENVIEEKLEELGTWCRKRLRKQ
jgi:hypothetical protein